MKPNSLLLTILLATSSLVVLTPTSAQLPSPSPESIDACLSNDDCVALLGCLAGVEGGSHTCDSDDVVAELPAGCDPTDVGTFPQQDCVPILPEGCEPRGSDFPQTPCGLDAYTDSVDQTVDTVLAAEPNDVCTLGPFAESVSDTLPACAYEAVEAILASDSNPADGQTFRLGAGGVIVDVDLTPAPGVGCAPNSGLCENSIQEGAGRSATFILLVADGCALHIKEAGAGGTDFARYHQYSDLDNDGKLDVDEVMDGSDPIGGCDLPALGEDSDLDGLKDSQEDSNGDGFVGPASSGETDPGNPDTDADGLSDCQEKGGPAPGPVRSDCPPAPGTKQYNTDPRKADTDGDGFQDGVEVAAGTSPTSPGSKPTAPDVVGIIEDTIEDLLAPGPTPPDSDLDDDGLSNDQEAELGTNPNNPDTDGDGVNDYDEVYGNYARASPGNCEPTEVAAPAITTVLLLFEENGIFAPAEVVEVLSMAGCYDRIPTDPKVQDTDGDGLRDDKEVGPGGSPGAGQYATDPTVKDTDGDTIEDGAEVSYGYDPTKVDTDADALDDNVEDSDKDGVMDAAAESDPKKADTDGDGIRDDKEKNGPDGTTDSDIANCRQSTDCDGDGISDGKEDASKNGGLDAAESNPYKDDTDGDSVPDNKEDADLDGVRDANELHPNKADTDADTLLDGTEDSNKNGAVDSTETDGTKADTDGDGLRDDVEVAHGGIAAARDPYSDYDGDTLTDCQEYGSSLVDGVADPTTVLSTPRGCDGREPSPTDPMVADTDGDGVRDDDDPNPTLPIEVSEEVCQLTGQDCLTLAGAPAQVGLGVLNTLRVPTSPLGECNFLDPGSWNLPGRGYTGFPVNEDPEEAASNGFVRWTDGSGNYLLWDGDPCNDVGDPGDRDESLGGNSNGDDTPFEQHLGNYVFGIVDSGSGDPEALQEAIDALVAQLADDAAKQNFADRRDPADTDEDGITNEPNGQVDLIEDRLLIVDPHGTVALPVDLGQDGSGSQASGLTGQLPDGRDGLTIVLRNPQTTQVMATVSVYDPSTGTIVIVEAFAAGQINTVCIDADGVVLTSTGRYNGSCGTPVDETAAATADAVADQATELVEDTTEPVLDADGDGFDLLAEVLAEGCFSPEDEVLGSNPDDQDSTPTDCDGDGVANGADAFPYDPTASSELDGDGVKDGADNCPTVANSDQKNTDGANDGGDACDTDDDNDTFSDAAETAAGSDPLKATSTPNDRDGDGVANASDNCPDAANAGQVDQERDGVGDACEELPNLPTQDGFTARITFGGALPVDDAGIVVLADGDNEFTANVKAYQATATGYGPYAGGLRFTVQGLTSEGEFVTLYTQVRSGAANGEHTFVFEPVWSATDLPVAISDVSVTALDRCTGAVCQTSHYIAAKEFLLGIDDAAFAALADEIDTGALPASLLTPLVLVPADPVFGLMQDCDDVDPDSTYVCDGTPTSTIRKTVYPDWPGIRVHLEDGTVLTL